MKLISCRKSDNTERRVHQRVTVQYQIGRHLPVV